MYYRILVNKHGQPFFRTSRLHSAPAMLNARAGLAAGFQGNEFGDFDPESGYVIDVLSVNDEGTGRILDAAEVTAINNEALAAAQQANQSNNLGS